jgi:hypothetical protein
MILNLYLVDNGGDFMNYINKKINKFDIEYVIKENCLDDKSILKNSKFWFNLDESDKINVANFTTTIQMKNSRKRLEYLNKKKIFHDIPQTKGIVSKSSLYKPTKKSLDILEFAINKSKGINQNEAIRAISVCKEGLKNLELNQKYFVEAYKENDATVMLTYQNVYSLIIVMTSYIYINCFKINDDCTIEYIDPAKNVLNKTLPLKEIEKFNETCRNKKLPEIRKFNETMEELDYNNIFNEADLTNENIFKPSDDAIKQKLNIPDMLGNTFKGIKKAKDEAPKPLKFIGTAAIIIGATIAIIHLIRNGIMFFYYKKNSIAKDLEFLSDQVEANAIVGEHDPTKSGKVVKKQRELSKKIKKLGKELEDDFKDADFASQNSLKKEDSMTSKQLENNINPDNDDGSQYTNSNDDLFI